MSNNTSSIILHLKLNFGGSIWGFVGKYQTLTSGYSSSSSNEVHPSVSPSIIELVLLDMQKKTIPDDARFLQVSNDDTN
jgi:hypothetical protein